MDNNTTSNFLLTEVSTTIEAIQFYYVPILVYFGTFGNTVSVYVFFRTKLKKLSSSYYLAALAISDTIFLIQLFVLWLGFVKLDLYNLPIMCQAMNYLASVCSFMSVWLVLAFTVERFVAVKYPLLRAAVCTISRAKMMILILTVVGMLLYSPIPMSMEIRYNKDLKRKLCTNKQEWEWNYFNTIFNIVDTIITIVVPLIAITVLNCIISRTIWKLTSVRKRLTNRNTSNSKKLINTRNKSKPSVSTQNQLTEMLLVVSTVCLSLNLPSYMARTYTFFIEVSTS